MLNITGIKKCRKLSKITNKFNYNFRNKLIDMICIHHYYNAKFLKAIYLSINKMRVYLNDEKINDN